MPLWEYTNRDDYTPNSISQTQLAILGYTRLMVVEADGVRGPGIIVVHLYRTTTVACSAWAARRAGLEGATCRMGHEMMGIQGSGEWGHIYPQHHCLSDVTKVCSIRLELH